LNAITQITDSSLESVLEQYNIGTLVRYWSATNGIENSNFFLRTRSAAGDCEYVLTIMEQAPYSGASYVTLLKTLHTNGLAVAPPLVTRAGQNISQLAGKPAMLQHRLPGHHVRNPTLEQICSIARFTARMHLTASAASIKLPEYPRTHAWLTAQIAKVRGRLSFSDGELLNNSMQKVSSLLTRKDVEKLPQGAIHADLFRDNALFNSFGLSGVIDFHHAAQGYWIYDLAVLANDWCTDGTGLLDPDRTLALLRAYNSLRALCDAELWFFSDFTLYAALTFWLSRLAPALANGSTDLARKKNPEEFQRIVAHHIRHSFFVDARQLNS